MTLYKVSAADGLSFHEPRVDYGAALVSGDVIRHPARRKVRNDASTYLSVSTSAADCTGFIWPCRLFRVEAVGRVMGAGKVQLAASPNKRAVSALRVVEELPAWQAFGPNGEAVVAFLDACAALTAEDWRKVAARDAAWDAAGDAAWVTAWDAAGDAAWDAAGATVVRDLLTPDQYATLTQPFVDAGFASMVVR